MNIQNLLYRSESDSLDFKEEQYKFINEDSKYIKSELLKDILAFANSWRDSDAYILIGIREKKDNYHEIVGISEHIDDASLQEFINSKTNRAIKFEYATTTLEDKQIAYIKIPTQRRPFYVIKDYGNVKTNTVYLRRGSATVTANPDEISAMGEDLIKTNMTSENPVDYSIEVKLTPLIMDINREKSLIEEEIKKAHTDLSTFDDNMQLNSIKRSKLMAINHTYGRKNKEPTLYKQDLENYKSELISYIEHYTNKLENLDLFIENYLSNKYLLTITLENIGKTSDTNIDVFLQVSNGEIFKKMDLLSVYKQINDVPYPEKPLSYTETTIKPIFPSPYKELDYLRNVHNPNFYRQNLEITKTSISLVIRDMNVGDNISLITKPLFLITNVTELKIKAVIKSNKSTSKITKNIKFTLNEKHQNINNFFKEESE